ncbi:MAG: PAS domain S-box protein [Ignavibacteria bacterium]|nr:PAS domain S-box protein [Ignavibacteria bacterium]MBT8380774.1 PAS domain S-box protein [Ignavibacteria bacterium]NNJ53223.1 PAS domain S-box protein [Ignavibacteriaceae bacterium]NNL22332.1 PAS domain S-box protein [Ignavibacteriaceae bacterium]
MEEKIATLIEQIPIGIFTYSYNGNVEFVNKNFKKYSILYQIALPHPHFNVFENDLFPTVSIKDELKKTMEGIPFEKEIKYVRSNNGGSISVIVKGTPVFEDDKITGGILLIDDVKVSDKKPPFETEKPHLKELSSFFIVTNNEGIIESTNGRIDKHLFSVSERITGRNILEIISPEVTHLIVKNYNTVFKQKQKISFFFSLKLEKTEKHFECKLEPHLNSEGKVQLIYFYIKNLVEEQPSKEQIPVELDYYKKAALKFNQAVLAIDNDGKINYWDENSENIFHLTATSTIGKFISEIFTFITKDKFDEVKNTLQQKDSFTLSGSFEKILQFSLQLELTFLRAEKISETVLVLCKQIEREQILSNKFEMRANRLKELLKSETEPTCKIDSNGTILLSNPAFKSKLGYPDIELYRTNFLGLIKQKEEIEPDEKLDINIIRSGKVKEAELELVAFNGDLHSFKVKFLPDKESDERFPNFYCLFSELKLELKEHSELYFYKSLLKASQDGIAVSLDSNIMIANDSFAKIFGYDKSEDVYDKNLLDFVADDDVLKVSEYFKLKENNKNGPERFEFLATKKDDSYFYAELSVALFVSNKQKYIVTVARDVTERKRAQKVIRESEQKYRNITENIDDFLYTFERTGEYLRPLFYTASVEKITGYTQSEFLLDPKLFLKIIHPDDFTSLKKKLATLWRSGFHSSSELEFRILNKQGNIVWVRNKVNIIRDSKGGIQKIYGLVSDITLSKRAEEELKESAENLKKLNEAKDRFLSIISHDLRTPFSSILGFTDLLLTDEALSEMEKKQYVRYIQDSSKSMLALVNSLLDWTRLQTGRIKFEPEKLNARELVEKSVSSSAGTALQKHISIQNLIDASLNVFVDKNLAQQIFSNLISNAIKFTTNGDKVLISASPVIGSRFLEFTVKDTGRGIKEDNLPKLFNIDMKFTSEGTAGEKGSGLGLSLVKEIVERHGGTVSVTSEYGKGSEFKLTLPVASNKILIIDNNKTDRILYSKIIKNITPDFDVDIVSNGKEALDKISSSPPALVITENEMPELNGYNFILELIRQNIFSKLPVIVLSGKIERNILQEYAELGIEYIFKKPVNLKDFKQAVEKSIRKGITNNTNST